MSSLEIVFKKVEELTPQELVEMNEVDHLAFYEEDGDDPWWQEWATPEMRFLGKEAGLVVSTVGLIRREILVGEKVCHIGGIGGVATLPARQRMGFAGRLMEASTDHMRYDPWYEYGMLFCDPKRISYYAKSGYSLIENRIYVRRNGERVSFVDTCMALPLRGLEFPAGDVDCQGLPW
jgi:predicted N-acetyltransferase YhbS